MFQPVIKPWYSNFK